MVRETKRAFWPILKVYQTVLGTGFLSTRLGRWLFVSAYNLYKQTIEARYTNMLLKYIPTRSTVVDVGANIGFFTGRFARQVGPHGPLLFRMCIFALWKLKLKLFLRRIRYQDVFVHTIRARRAANFAQTGRVASSKR